MTKKYTRQAYYDKSEKVYNIFYTNLEGKIKIIKQSYVKEYVKYILAEENKGKHKNTLKIPTQKESFLIEQKIKRTQKIIATVDRLLKKSDDKITDYDKELLSFYANTPYRQQEILKKGKRLLSKKQKKELKEKNELLSQNNMIIIKDFWVTYCHKSVTFFYFANPIPEKNEKSNEELINDALKGLLYYDHTTGKFLEKKIYHRLRISYNLEDVDENNIYLDYDAPENMHELESVMEEYFELVGETPWTNELCNIHITGLL